VRCSVATLPVGLRTVTTPSGRFAEVFEDVPTITPPLLLAVTLLV
jgi:hypothetical protein